MNTWNHSVSPTLEITVPASEKPTRKSGRSERNVA